MTVWRWITTLLSRRPHHVIGGAESPYMLRWYLIPRNPWLNVYLHKFCRSDDNRALHDHPWWFVSLMIRGRYWEVSEIHGVTILERRTAPSIAFRAATHRHMVALANGPDGRPAPCWTIVLTGRKVREWGFWCPRGFIPWHQFVDPNDPGAIGPGCGE